MRVHPPYFISKNFRSYLRKGRVRYAFFRSTLVKKSPGRISSWRRGVPPIFKWTGLTNLLGALNKQSPTQVVQKTAFWGRLILKPNSERVVEMPGQMCIVQKFKAVSTAQRPDFHLLPLGRYSGIKNGKNWETTNSPSPLVHYIVFLVNRPCKK